MRIGYGYDVHPLGPDRKLILGGIEISHTKGLLGHSDSDVLVHAICDALLPLEDLPESLDAQEIVRDAALFVSLETRNLPGRLAWMFAGGMLFFETVSWIRFGKSLARVSRPARKAWVERWAYGGFAPARQLFRAVRSVALLAFYEHEALRPFLVPAATLGDEEVGLARDNT